LLFTSVLLCLPRTVNGIGAGTVVTCYGQVAESEYVVPPTDVRSGPPSRSSPRRETPSPPTHGSLQPSHLHRGLVLPPLTRSIIRLFQPFSANSTGQSLPRYAIGIINYRTSIQARLRTCCASSSSAATFKSVVIGTLAFLFQATWTARSLFGAFASGPGGRSTSDRTTDVRVLFFEQGNLSSTRCFAMRKFKVKKVTLRNSHSHCIDELIGMGPGR
jgi:hypothetical protein